MSIFYKNPKDQRAFSRIYFDFPHAKIGIKIKGKKIRPTVNHPPRPKLFESLSVKKMVNTIFKSIPIVSVAS